MYVPAISDTAHRTLATANDSEKTKCRTILSGSETDDEFRGPNERCDVVACGFGERHTTQGPARAAGALVKASTGPIILSVRGDVVT